MIIAGSSVDITIGIGEDATGMVSAKISYVDPLGTSGTWEASPLDLKKGTFIYKSKSTDLLQAGMWTVWLVITFSDTKVWKTAASRFTVYAEGTVDE